MKKVKWLVIELYERKLRQRLSTWLQKIEAELGEANHGKKDMVKNWKYIYVCQKKGPILGEDDESIEE